MLASHRVILFRGKGINPAAPNFHAAFADLGAGAVDTALTFGSDSATFARATAASTVGSTGLIVDVASGVARSRYDPVSMAYQGYFAESAATNVCLQSEDFGTTWGAVGTPTRSAAAATCGTLVLDLLGDDAAGTLEGYSQTVTFTGNSVKAISIFFKQGSSVSSVVRLRDTTGGADRLLAAITWAAGVPTVTMTTGSLVQIVGPFGASGVYRAEMLTTSVTAANTNSLQVYPATDAALAVAGTGDIHFGGVMAQNDGTQCGSYVKTTVSAVTRNADSLSYTAANMSAAIGTAYAECSAVTPVVAGDVPYLDGGSASQGLFIGRAAALTTINMDDGPTILTKTGLTSLLNTPRKRASAWGGATMSITGDGVGPDSGAFDGAMTATSVRVATPASNASYPCIKNAKIWFAKATDGQLQALTA